MFRSRMSEVQFGGRLLMHLIPDLASLHPGYLGFNDLFSEVTMLDAESRTSVATASRA
jgi:hypothetical protein